nr:unnamed protein product [Digitaria exilis]
MAEGNRAPRGTSQKEKAAAAVRAKKEETADPQGKKEAPANETEHIQELMRLGFLSEEVISGWRISEEDSAFPSEDTGEVTVFRRYFEVGFGLPTHEFFRGVLGHYGIQAAHLSLNSYLHLSIFIHVCENFLGIDLHFELFLNLFRLKSVPKDEDPKYISGATFQFKQGMQEKYIPYKTKDTHLNWEQEGFYVSNYAPSLPDRMPDRPWRQNCWNQIFKESATDQIEVLLEKIGKLREAGLTGAGLYLRFLQWRIQPLRIRQNTGYQYVGRKDPDQSRPELLSNDEAMVFVMKMPPQIPKYSAANPPTEARHAREKTRARGPSKPVVIVYNSTAWASTLLRKWELTSPQAWVNVVPPLHPDAGWRRAAIEEATDPLSPTSQVKLLPPFPKYILHLQRACALRPCPRKMSLLTLLRPTLQPLLDQDAHQLSSQPSQGDEEDVGLVVCVVEEVGAMSAEEVEEIPRVIWPQEEEMRPVGDSFRMVFIDEDEEAQMFHRELNHVKLRKGQDLAVSCLHKSTLLQCFVKQQAVMDFLENRLREERVTIKKSHDEMEAFKIVMNERNAAIEKAEARIVAETEKDQLKVQAVEDQTEVLTSSLQVARDHYQQVSDAAAPLVDIIGTAGNSRSHEACLQELRDAAKELPMHVRDTASTCVTHVRNLEDVEYTALKEEVVPLCLREDHRRDRHCRPARTWPAGLATPPNGLHFTYMP